MQHKNLKLLTLIWITDLTFRAWSWRIYLAAGSLTGDSTESDPVNPISSPSIPHLPLNSPGDPPYPKGPWWWSLVGWRWFPAWEPWSTTMMSHIGAARVEASGTRDGVRGSGLLWRGGRWVLTRGRWWRDASHSFFHGQPRGSTLGVIRAFFLWRSASGRI
jgi:hypothetical protein